MSALEGSPIQIPKAATVVASRIRRNIARGELQPGDPLPNETELMALYDVSRPVIREALRILESESLLSIKRGAGGGARFQMPDITVAARHTAMLLQLEGVALSDLFEARSMLEPYAVRRLAEQHDPEVIARLRALHDRELELVDDFVGYPMHAASFHRNLVELAGNRTLAVLSRLLITIVEAQNRLTFQGLDDRAAHDVASGASEWHGKLIDLIEAGDADGAEAHWREHLDNAARTALGQLGPATVVDLLDPHS
ncbi:MAG: FadR/GntR family transcriptional regulator [Acidimicrobiia bacterium]